MEKTIQQDRIAGAMEDAFRDKRNGNVAEGLFAIAQSLEHVAEAIDRLTHDGLCSYKMGLALDGLSRLGRDDADETE